MKILITGAAGFIGSNTANYLHKKYDIVALDNLKFGNRKNLNKDVQFYEIDFVDVSNEYLNQFDILIHLATANIIYAMDNHVDTFKANALETINLFNRFKGKIIYTSTTSVYGQATIVPTPEEAEERVDNAYDQSKLLAEKFLQFRGNYTTLRLSNVYGPLQRPTQYSGVVSKFIEAGSKKKTMHSFGNGSDTRDYTYVSDVVDAIEKVAISVPLNTEINISGNCEMSISGLIMEISNLMNVPVNMTSTAKRGIDNISRRWLDCSKAYKLIGWKPNVSLIEGIKKTIAWYKGEY